MLVRDCLKAGCYVSVVPIGIPLTIRYNEKGMIEMVSKGYNADNMIPNEELLVKFIETNKVPRTIPLVNGTSWIHGVLYTGDLKYNDSDKLYVDMLIDKFLSGESEFNFFVGNIKSKVREFPSALSVNQWCSIAKFNTLPNFIVPITLTEDRLDAIINNGSYPFTYPLVDGYWVWEMSECEYHSNDLSISKVISAKQFANPAGRILANIDLDNARTLTIDYYDFMKFKIKSGDVLVIDHIGNILYNLMRSADNGPIYYTCPDCGTSFVVEKDIPLYCKNTHCVSIMYPEVNRFLETLHFDTVSKSDFQSIVDTCGKAFMLPDILELPQFGDVVKECTLSEILRATIPLKYVPVNSKLISTIVQDSNNAVKTVQYFLANFERFLQSTNYQLDCSIKAWLNDERNLLELDAIINNPHIKIKNSGKKFDGAPIFRGKIIMVTGKFLHGNFDEIKAIFSSYGAETIPTFNSSADCLVIGDMKEDISGAIINSCRKINLPIFGETEFFDRYEIDEDMAENL